LLSISDRLTSFIYPNFRNYTVSESWCTESRPTYVGRP